MFINGGFLLGYISLILKHLLLVLTNTASRIILNLLRIVVVYFCFYYKYSSESEVNLQNRSVIYPIILFDLCEQYIVCIFIYSIHCPCN
jgi:hypothetical protein